MDGFSAELTQSGQRAAYQDTLRFWTITAPEGSAEAAVIEFARTLMKLDANANRNESDSVYSGHGGFANGPDHSWSLAKTSPTAWRYRVCEPFCD